MTDKITKIHAEWVLAVKKAHTYALDAQARREDATEAQRQLNIAREELRQVEVALWNAMYDEQDLTQDDIYKVA